MTKKQVLKILGFPSHSSVYETKRATFLNWRYGNGTVITFYNGKVYSIFKQ